MNSIIYFFKSYVLADRSRYDPDIYWAMEPYKKDLFWHLREIRHSKRSVNKPSAAMPDVDVLDPSLLTQKCSPSELDELRILEICVNPLLTSNHKHFPYYSQNTIVCEDRSLRRVSGKRSYMSIGNLNSLSKFSDGSFDAVVVTLMLCSSWDIDFHIGDIHRVLAEGGHLYFLEYEPQLQDGLSEDCSTVSTILLRQLTWFLSLFSPSAESRSVVAALRRNRFLKCDVLQSLYLPDTYPDRKFVLGFAIK
ncbi:uncharacterized protein LOC111251700 isoform X1 [Varroa destructor]|uniref:Methyltransferase type 11 domain-containing protein n=1 Tax=Varroa destructor TaxID=109461 RepID=A0A7M7KCR3_VARDE|nr:uncharacterized protein LOC111251700 isoform X1 [Varroa destructor]XP_022664294.1 uncharacterized protein LOC111251700 isoform X1 [Varroa destructor]XP_022664295.1 uncharacterized protein LOC111251700 isoform X1 [Varroa destructor]XP_022664296.1 uncharacterized protein LOC111251700 isoform X1 [Varroa destructor]